MIYSNLQGVLNEPFLVTNLAFAQGKIDKVDFLNGSIKMAG
jgi:hypothetical protein